MMIEITHTLLESSKGEHGFTKPQVTMTRTAIKTTNPYGLRNRLVENEWWERFCRMGKIGQPVSLPPKKKPKREKKHKKKWKGSEFYTSDAWRKLRYRVIRKWKAICMACGRSYREHGVVIHVDHIKPRSKHPHLELVFENLQVLCEDCNQGKGNTDEIDWRPKV